MFQPNDMDNPEMDNEYKIGDIVYWAGPNVDEFDRLSDQPKTPHKIIRIGSSQMSWAYQIESPDGNQFFVTVDEIESEASYPDPWAC